MIEIRSPSGLLTAESVSLPSASRRLPALMRNEIVQGKVIQLLAEKDAVITIKGRSVIARSQVPLEKDHVLLLKVEQTSPRPLLRVLGAMGQFPGLASVMQAVEQNPWRQLLESLKKPVVSGSKQAQLQHLLKDLSTLLQKPRGGDLLREWIQKSGISLESRLRVLCLQGRQTSDEVNQLVAEDLKGLLVRIMDEKEGASPMLERLLKVTETLQWFNHGSLAQGGKLFLLLPCQDPEGFWTVAQLMIQKEEESPSKGQRKTRACRVVFLSEFSNLGWVRTEVMVHNKEVRIGFVAASAETMTRLQEHLPLLIGNLVDRGYQVNETSCDTLDQELLKHSMAQELKGVGTPPFSTFV